MTTTLPESGWPRPVWIFTSLVCLSSLIGLAESAALLLRHAWTGELAWAGPRILWMAPAGYALLCLGPAFLLALGAGWRPMLGPKLFAFGVFGLCLVGGVTLLRVVSQQRLHLAAMILVALGAGIQAGRAIAQRPGVAFRLTRKLFPAVAAILSVALLGTEGLRAIRGRTSERAAAEVVRGSERLNVLLLILDTVRAMELGLYGSPFPTSPVLDSLARHATVFQNAFATSSWTLPSHASMFTGRFPHEVDADWRRPLDRTYPTVAELLRERGYHTAGFVGNLSYTTEETGLARGFARYEDYPVTLKEVFWSTEFAQLVLHGRARLILRRHDAKRADALLSRFVRWQSALDGRPYFAFVNLFDAHTPRYAPDSLRHAFAGRTGQVDRDRYAAAIAYMDGEIGELLNELRRQGALQRTAVIITSDHGEQFGSHGLYDHGNSLYTSVVRVPLLVMTPDGAGAGIRVQQPVSLRNLAATIMDLAGQGVPEEIPGASLRRFWRAPEPGSEPQDAPVLSELTPSPRVPVKHRNARGELRSLVQGQWHYIVNGDRSTELYDYWADPGEETSLAGVPQGAESALTGMQQWLTRLEKHFPLEPEPERGSRGR